MDFYGNLKNNIKTQTWSIDWATLLNFFQSKKKKNKLELILENVH